MIKVETYIKVNDEFVPLANFAGDVPEPDYVEGAIELEINGIKVLTLELWDDVNWLWPYISQGLIEINTQQQWSTYFPDQPIKLTFTTDELRRRITVSVFLPADKVFDKPEQHLKASASYEEFRTAMSEAAQEFFRRMAELIPEERADWERELRTLQAGVPLLQRG
jgi:hypothetical protein